MLHFNPKEIIAAASDAIALIAGGNVSRPHPIANQLSMREVARGFGIAKDPHYAAGRDDRTVEAFGLMTSDFSQALIRGLLPLAVVAYYGQAEHLSFVSKKEVVDFKPVNIPAVDMDVDLELIGEGAEVSHFSAVLSGGAREVALASFGRTLTLSRVAMVNNEMLALGQLFASAGGSAARLESRLVAAAMEGNPTLDDGKLVFGSEYSNVLTGVDGAFSNVAAAKAAAMLRKQPTESGQRADLRAKHLVVEPELEMFARSFVKEYDPEIKVSVLAGLPDGRWYLMADPTLAPTVGVLRLAGMKDPVTAKKPMERMSGDGIHTRVIADLGACLLRRIGIVRGG